MEYIAHYDNMYQRDNLCWVANFNGFRMLHDNFDADWKRGDEPHGTLTFTDEEAPQAPPPEPSRIDKLEARIKKLENLEVIS